MEKFSEAYLARCQKTLRSWGAPVSGWTCAFTNDVAGEEDSTDLATCELCGCPAVRFVHVMEHPEYGGTLEVGCVCAGIVEGDMIAARERERQARNRANRRKRFVQQEWSTSKNGNQTLKYKGQRVTIIPSKFGGFGVVCEGETVWKHKGQKIPDFQTAARVAFEIIDQPTNPGKGT